MVGKAHKNKRALISLGAITLLLLPMIASATQIETGSDEPIVERWWDNTSMDKDKDGIHDAIWIAIDSTIHDWVDERGYIGVIVDFDHTPTLEDEKWLIDEVDFEVKHRFHVIDSIAGNVSIHRLVALSKIPGVVMIEIDGVLEVSNAEVKDVHGVWDIYDETGYDGSGVVVAIIDTGIDGLHVGLDDLDDDNSTDDPKIIGFYDAVNNPGKTNGSEVFPYDDHGHGSHCAGTTAGTGAPTYEHTGLAPQAQLVGVKVLDGGGSGSFSGVMMGMEWTVDMRHKLNIRAASMSLGGPGAIEWTSAEEESVNRMGNEMMYAGIALFIAAGNNGVSGQIGTPGSAEDVITVGALDKDTKIAVYSSQGPTEEGRIKPNIAFVGSSVMSVEANSVTGYTGMSGTSMATPGAAGLAALMYQANPSLNALEIRNIMQETATYRQCHYMLVNEPCVEDLIPKNRQNNVYGHGQAEALPALMDAANYGKDWYLDTSINVSVVSPTFEDNKVGVGKGDSIEYAVSGDVSLIQWRGWEHRDFWRDLDGFTPGDTSAEIEYCDLVRNFDPLENNVISDGTGMLDENQTIYVRALKNTNASTNEVTHLYLSSEGAESCFQASSTSAKGGVSVAIVGAMSFAILLLLIATCVMFVQLNKEGVDIGVWPPTKNQ